MLFVVLFFLTVQDKAEECLQQLEAKKRDIAKLQEREKTLHSTFHVSLGENNKFADFLTKVFKKKIKRVKKKEKKGDEGVSPSLSAIYRNCQIVAHNLFTNVRSI